MNKNGVQFGASGRDSPGNADGDGGDGVGGEGGSPVRADGGLETAGRGPKHPDPDRGQAGGD